MADPKRSANTRFIAAPLCLDRPAKRCRLGDSLPANFGISAAAKKLHNPINLSIVEELPLSGCLGTKI
jgi:hypothetical protein